MGNWTKIGEEKEDIDMGFSRIAIMDLLSKHLHNTCEGVQFLVKLYTGSLWLYHRWTPI